MAVNITRILQLFYHQIEKIVVHHFIILKLLVDAPQTDRSAGWAARIVVAHYRQWEQPSAWPALHVLSNSVFGGGKPSSFRVIESELCDYF